MTHARFITMTIFLVGLAVLVGCQTDLDVNRFRYWCDGPDHCMDGYQCVRGECVKDGALTNHPDGGHNLDVGPVDVEASDVKSDPVSLDPCTNELQQCDATEADQGGFLCVPQGATARCLAKCTWSDLCAPGMECLDHVGQGKACTPPSCSTRNSCIGSTACLEDDGSLTHCDSTSGNWSAGEGETCDPDSRGSCQDGLRCLQHFEPVHTCQKTCSPPDGEQQGCPADFRCVGNGKTGICARAEVGDVCVSAGSHCAVAGSVCSFNPYVDDMVCTMSCRVDDDRCGELTNDNDSVCYPYPLSGDQDHGICMPNCESPAGQAICDDTDPSRTCDAGVCWFRCFSQSACGAIPTSASANASWACETYMHYCM